MKKYSIRNINDVDILTFVKISAFIRYFEEELKYPVYSVRRLNEVPKNDYGYIVNIVTAKMEHEFIKSVEPEIHLMVVARYTDENMFKEYLVERSFGCQKFSYEESLKGYEEHLRARLEKLRKAHDVEGSAEMIFERSLIETVKNVLNRMYYKKLFSGRRKPSEKKIKTAMAEYDRNMEKFDKKLKEISDKAISAEERDKQMKAVYDEYRSEYGETFEQDFEKIKSKVSQKVYHKYIMMEGRCIYTVEWLSFLYRLYLRNANIFEVTQIMARLKKTEQVTEKDWLEMVATNRRAIETYLLYVRGEINHNLLFGSDADVVEKTYQEYSRKIVKHKYYDDPRLLQEEFEEEERNAETDWFEEPIYERNYMKEYNFLSDLRYSIGKAEKFIASDETAEWCRKSMEVNAWVEETKKNLAAFKEAKYLVVWTYLYS